MEDIHNYIAVLDFCKRRVLFDYKSIHLWRDLQHAISDIIMNLAHTIGKRDTNI